jgi:hypothetical protein
MTTPLRGLLLAAGAAALMLAASCADFTSNENANAKLPDVLIAHPSLQTDLQPVFTARCAIGGCHTVAEDRIGLILADGYTYSSTVNVVSVHGAPLLRVAPGDHANSWLWRVVQGDTLLHPGLPRMPLAAQPLTSNMIQNIANWIDDGAPNN